MHVFNINMQDLEKKLEAITKLTTQVAPQVTVELMQYMGVQVQRIWVNELFDAPQDKHKAWGLKAGETVKVDVKGSKVRIYADEEEIDPRSGKKKILYMNIIEDGIKSWSIKDALLSSKRVHVSAKGTKYIHVPFRYRVPGAQKKHTYFSGVMPSEIYNIVKGGKTTLKGGEYGRMAGLAKHGREKHSQYFTFRTVSERSAGWVYPAIAGTPVYKKVLSQLEKMFPVVLENFCKAMIDRIKDA